MSPSASTEPFKAKGDKPEWELIFPLFRDAVVGEVIRYDALAEALGRDPRENRGPIYRVTRELETRYARTLNSVRGEGYRITPEPEVVSLVSGRIKRSRRQTAKAKRTGTSVDRQQLTPPENEKLDRVMERVGRLEQAHRAMRERQEKLELRAEKAERSDQKLTARLDKLTDSLKKRGLLDE